MDLDDSNPPDRDTHVLDHRRRRLRALRPRR